MDKNFTKNLYRLSFQGIAQPVSFWDIPEYDVKCPLDGSLRIRGVPFLDDPILNRLWKFGLVVAIL